VRSKKGTRHTIARLGSKRTLIPRHPTQEIKAKTLHAIFKDLGLKTSG
jgi:predicted RNA binding protein YcfA (HicA-like mRNA interferase family)